VPNLASYPFISFLFIIGHGRTREANPTCSIAEYLFTIVEIVGGLWTNSLAILSDALHDFGDSVALGGSMVLERESRREPDSIRTFGYQRLSPFSALFSALVLVGGSMVILSQVHPWRTEAQ